MMGFFLCLMIAFGWTLSGSANCDNIVLRLFSLLWVVTICYLVGYAEPSIKEFILEYRTKRREANARKR